MQAQYLPSQEWLQASAGIAQQFAQCLEDFVASLVSWLDAYLDKRLVRTLVQTIQAILTLRQRATGLLLTELDAYLESPDHAPVGTKWLSNLLQSSKWASRLIGRFLQQRADKLLTELEQAGEERLVLWDESVLEKLESIALEGFASCAEVSRIASSASSRATTIQRVGGYFCPGHELATCASCHGMVDDARLIYAQPMRGRGTSVEVLCCHLGTVRVELAPL